MARRAHLWTLSLALWLAGACLPPARGTGNDALTTVLVVRHAERAAEPAGDPVLTAAGEARARALLPIAREAGVSAIVITHLQRTRLTALPTSDSLGIVPTVVMAGGADHAREVARVVLEQYRGRTVLVVGHSNTVPAIVEALGGGAQAEICDFEYDRLYVVRVPGDGRVQTTRGSYGVPTPADAGAGCRKM